MDRSTDTRPLSGARFRLLATTDLHAHIRAHDYYADRALQRTGLALAATLIERLRSEVPNGLLVDNGDFLQGNPIGDCAVEAAGVTGGRTHPMISAMNALGYDAAALGNHEFNYGVAFLLTALEAATFPVVCANVATAQGGSAAADTTLVPPFALLTRTVVCENGALHPLRVGLLGLLPPQIMSWDAQLLTGRVSARDIVPTAATWVPRMRQAGADIIVVLCHSGIGPMRPAPGMENAATALGAVPGIDAIVAGHSHLVFPSEAFRGQPGVNVDTGTLGGTPAVMAGCFGSHVGLIDFDLVRSADRWQVAATRTEARPVGGGTMPLQSRAARAILRATRADHAAAVDWARRPVGHSLAPLNSFFAALPGNAALALVAEAQRQHVAETLRGTPHSGLPLLSAAAPFKMGGRGGPDHYTDVPAGEIAQRSVADLYLYPNTIRALCVTGRGLADWLEWSACLFLTLTPGGVDQRLLDPDLPSSQFDVISGVTWEVDLAAPPRFHPDGRPTGKDSRRVRNLRRGGRPVSDTDRFIVATNSYRSASSVPFDVEEVVLDSSQSNRDILRRHIAGQKSVAVVRADSWRFCRLPGTSAILDTGPGAAAHLDSIAALGPEIAGMTPDGFLRVRLRL